MPQNNNTVFAERLSKLNPEQKKAVETISGPVMVIAGPGTGKTETLGARIANILSQTDSHPHTILCLTYTNAGVVAMRKRLLEFIGADAQKVEIHTFHSFCNQVIQENPEIFSDARDEENISELEQYEIMDSLLDSVSPDHPFFSHHGNSYWSKELLKLFSVLKSEQWTTPEVQKKVSEYLKFLPEDPQFQYSRKYTNKTTGETFQKGDVKLSLLKKEEEKMQKLLAGLELFALYSDEMNRRGKYDFNDMILWVLEKFASDPDFLMEYQERFQYVLVDEFQDTNGSQKKLIDYLIDFWEDPNIFVVGDDDQSIYRFQGANMRNILDFAREHQNIKTITLTRNYRSTQPILDIAQAVISRNTERLESEISGLSKHLSAENPDRILDGENTNFNPRLTGYYNAIHEELGIFKKLKALHNRGDILSHVAVIYKNHSQAKNIIARCEQEGIPVRVKETQNILELPLTHFVMAMLEYIQAEKNTPFSGESLLYKMMYFPFWNINQHDIGLVTLALRKNNAKKYNHSHDLETEEISEISEGDKHLKTLLVSENLSEKISGLSDPDALTIFADTLVRLEQLSHTTPLTGFVEHLLYDTKLIEWVFSHEDTPYLLRVVSTFFSFVREEHQKKPALEISELLSIITQMNKHDLSIPIQKILYEKEGINFITAHSSKGLEFEYVFILGVNKRVWDSPQKSGGISFPNTLTLSNEGDHLEEARRLFFVAMTRAKKFLEISFAERDLNGKELDPSTFISELPLEPQSQMYDEPEILMHQRSLIQPIPPEKISILDTKYLQDILENYSLSATHLNKYLACPRAFYFENFLRIPKAMVSPMAFGNAIHRVLEYMLNAKEKTGNIADIPDFSEISEVFEREIHKYAYLFEKAEIQKKIAYGKEVLQKFSENIPAVWKNKSAAEYSVRTAVDGTPINGKLDAVHFLDENEVRVVDYKTGKVSNAREKLMPPNEKNDMQGGDYWRQLVFYKILLENDMRKPWVLQEGSMSFVEGDDKNPAKNGTVEKIISPTEEEVQIVKTQIAETYQNISNFEFSTGCEECEWCTFWRNV